MLTRRTSLGILAAAPLLARGGRPLFAMDTAVFRKFGDKLTREDLQMTADLGYSGIAPLTLDDSGWQHIVERVAPWTKELGIGLPAVYSQLRVTRRGCAPDPGIARYLPELQTTLWLPVMSEDLPPSSREADAWIVPAIREAGRLAQAQGCAVSLYPHYGSLVQTMRDALRLAEAAAMPNVGVTFNLCHWLRGEARVPLRETLRAAGSRLQIVTICGANRTGQDWKELIQPLDQGDFDVRALLRELDHAGFHGPIGLQGYAVTENFSILPEANLRRSMAAWKRATA